MVYIMMDYARHVDTALQPHCASNSCRATPQCPQQPLSRPHPPALPQQAANPLHYAVDRTPINVWRSARLRTHPAASKECPSQSTRVCCLKTDGAHGHDASSNAGMYTCLRKRKHTTERSMLHGHQEPAQGSQERHHDACGGRISCCDLPAEPGQNHLVENTLPGSRAATVSGDSAPHVAVSFAAWTMWILVGWYCFEARPILI
jgi:hypothetical protein